MKKLTYTQRETLVAILNESECDEPLVNLGLGGYMYNANTLKSLEKLGLIEAVGAMLTLPYPNTGDNLLVFKKMDITKLGKEVAFKELGF